MPFNGGDVVRLKSGGPKMTVEHVDEELDLVTCVWFENKDLKRDSFSATALQKI